MYGVLCELLKCLGCGSVCTVCVAGLVCQLATGRGLENMNLVLTQKIPILPVVCTFVQCSVDFYYFFLKNI